MNSSQDLKNLHYEYMLNSPLAKAMKSKIKALKKERKLLRRVILELGEKFDKLRSEQVIDLAHDVNDYPENIKYDLEENVVPVLDEKVETHKRIIKLEPGVEEESEEEESEEEEEIEVTEEEEEEVEVEETEEEEEVEEEEEEEEEDRSCGRAAALLSTCSLPPKPSRPAVSSPTSPSSTPSHRLLPSLAVEPRAPENNDTWFLRAMVPGRSRKSASSATIVRSRSTRRNVPCEVSRDPVRFLRLLPVSRSCSLFAPRDLILVVVGRATGTATPRVAKVSCAFVQGEGCRIVTLFLTNKHSLQQPWQHFDGSSS